MRKKIIAWSLFLACLLFLSFAATTNSRAADNVLISIRLTLVIVLSVLVVRERWRYSGGLRQSAPPTHADIGTVFLNRLRRWYHGE